MLILRCITGDLTTYDHIKRTIITKTGLPDSHTVHILSSICAGLVAAGMGTPADVVKTRVMNQPTDSNGRYVFVVTIDSKENEWIFLYHSVKGSAVSWSNWLSATNGLKGRLFSVVQRFPSRLDSNGSVVIDILDVIWRNSKNARRKFVLSKQKKNSEIVMAI